MALVAVAGSIAMATAIDPTSTRAVVGIGEGDWHRRSLPPDPLWASLPNENLVDFLKSPPGVVVQGLIVVAIGLGAGAAFLSVGRARGPGRPTTPARKRRSRGASEAGRTANALRSRPSSRVITAGLGVGCLLIPLLFVVALEDVFATPKTLATWILAGFLLLSLLYAGLQGVRPIRRDLITTAVGGYLLLNVAATVASGNPGHSLVGERGQYQGLITITAYCALFVAARYALAEVNRVPILSAALIASAVVASLYGLAQWFGLDPIWSELWKDRIFSTMGQANMLAAFLAAALLMTLPLASVERPRIRILVLLAALGVALTLILTLSRGGYVGLAAGMSAALIVTLRGMDVRLLTRYARASFGATLVIVLTVATSTVVWQPAPNLTSRIAARAATIVDPSESSNQIRLDLWTVALRIIGDHPVLGTGPDSFVLVFPKYRDMALPRDRAQNIARFRVESPHNAYLATASGAGLPAMAALAGLIVGALWIGFRQAWGPLTWPQRLSYAGLIGGSVALLVANAFMTAESASSAILFILLGALAGTAAPTDGQALTQRERPGQARASRRPDDAVA